MDYHTPINILVTGKTFCGKTHTLLRLLETNYRNVYECIVIICPTLQSNTSYLNWKYLHDPKIICLPVLHDQVDDIIAFVTDTYQGINTAIILDDCACTQSIKNRTSEAVKLAFGGGHNEHSLFILTQQFSSIAKPVRQNVGRLIAFYTPDKRDIKEICDSYLYGVEEDEIKKVLKILRDHKFSYLDISLRHPYNYKVVIPKL